MKKAMILLLAMFLTFTLSGSAESAVEGVEYISGDFTYTLDQSGNAEIIGYSGQDRDLRVPSEVDGHPMTSIGRWAFVENPRILCVTLPKGLQSIGDGAFRQCSNLVSVTLPEGLESIGTGAFLSCSRLSSVTLPEGLKDIGGFVFFKCSGLVHLTLPDSLMLLNGNPFVGFPDLSIIHVSPNHPVFEVTDGVLFNKEEKILVAYPTTAKPGAYRVPSGTRAIGDAAFRDCTGLTSIVLPEGLTFIDIGAFMRCSNLESIQLPKGLEFIGDGAFAFCSSLRSIVLPEGLESIRGSTFSNCLALVCVMLPDSLVRMEGNPFEDFRDLESIRLSPDHPVFTMTDGVLFNARDGILVAYPVGEKPGVYQIPSGTRAIGESAFINCTNLTGITFPDSLASIAGGAFAGCENLTAITLPNHLTSIESVAFVGCTRLESVELPKSLETIGDGAFMDCSRLVLTVPRDSYALKYAQDNGIPYEIVGK